MEFLNLKLLETKQETPTIKSFKIEKNNLNYKPGQYVMVEMDVEDADKGNTRPLSLSSSPTEDFLMISTKISDSKFKQKLASLSKQIHLE